MSENMAPRILWLVAVVLLVAGAGMTVSNLARYEDLSQRLKKKAAELRTLGNMEGDLARYTEARRQMEASGEKHPSPLNSLLQEVVPGIKFDDVRDSRKDLVSGWVIRQKELALNDVPVGKAMEFVRKAEAQKLPWCLTKCIVRSAPRASAGTGQVVLVMEALDRE